jgi:hypothetical protein
MTNAPVPDPPEYLTEAARVPYLVLRFGTRAAAADVPPAPRRDPADVIDERA